MLQDGFIQLRHDRIIGIDNVLIHRFLHIRVGFADVVQYHDTGYGIDRHIIGFLKNLIDVVLPAHGKNNQAKNGN